MWGGARVGLGKGASDQVVCESLQCPGGFDASKVPGASRLTLLVFGGGFVQFGENFLQVMACDFTSPASQLLLLHLFYLFFRELY